MGSILLVGIRMPVIEGLRRGDAFEFGGIVPEARLGEE
jgi:hypothetical protein